MARIVADKGRQRLQTGEGIGYHFVYEMDCGCEIRIDERTMLSGSSRSSVDLRGRLVRVAEAHDCEIVVHHAPERYRREIRQRRFTVDPPMTYMGIDIGSNPMTRWFTEWGLNTPRSRPQPAPQVSPEQEVRRAAEQLRGIQASGVVVDEQIGFKAPPKEPEKKPDPPRALTRWDLIEMD